MTLPNKITLGRMLCLPVVLALFYVPDFHWFLSGYILAWIFGLTDFLDGYLARRLKQVSLLGKIIDPIADKLMVLLTGLYFVDAGLLPYWALILLVLRELIISDFRIFALKQGREVAVSKGGKWKALFQYFLMADLGALRLVQLSNAGPQGLQSWPFVWFTYAYEFLLVGTLLLTLASLAEYFWSNRTLLSIDEAE